MARLRKLVKVIFRFNLDSDKKSKINSHIDGVFSLLIQRKLVLRIAICKNITDQFVLADLHCRVVSSEIY